MRVRCEGCNITCNYTQTQTETVMNMYIVSHRRNHHGDRGGDRSPELLKPWDQVGPSQLLGPVRQCNVHIGGKWIHSDISAADQFTCSPGASPAKSVWGGALDRGRGAHAIEAPKGWEMGRGYPPPQPTRGSGGAS